jgi:hypothetical protein
MSNSEQELTNKLLNLWHSDLNTLYNDKNMTFTAHAHMHLVDQVKRLGPLLRLEAFGFEDFLKNIKAKAIGTTYIGAQVVKRILLEKKSIKKALEIQNNETFDFLSNNLLPDVFKKDRVFHNDIKLISANTLSEHELRALEESKINIQSIKEIYCFYRLKQGNFIFNSSSYEKGHKRRS